MKRGSYNGVSDLMRYELLYENGGFIAEADSICLKNISRLFKKEKAYTVYENEFVRGKLVSPILASEPGNEFVGKLIETLANIDPHEIRTPWKDTGNLFCALMIEQENPDIEIFPSHFFNPSHYTGLKSNRHKEAYAMQMWGSTGNKYTNKNIATSSTRN